jgi:polysaccharide biosynthesis/export protein
MQKSFPTASTLGRIALRYTVLLSVGFMMSSCAFLQTRHILFQSMHDAEYRKAKGWKKPIFIHQGDTTRTQTVYKVNPFDVLSIRFSNIPEELVKASDMPNIQNSSQSSAPSITGLAPPFPTYQVDGNGCIVVPLLHRISVKGLTPIEIRDSLEIGLARFYRNPLVEVKATRLRAYFFGEVARQGQVELPSERIHLMEALAQAGGIPYTGKVQKVKIIRGNWKDPDVIWVNLRDLNSLKYSELYVQHQDIVYVEPRNAQLFIREVAPYSTIINLVTLIPTFVLLFSNVGRR